jgi:Cu/Ag efflux protein CusF
MWKFLPALLLAAFHLAPAHAAPPPGIETEWVKAQVVKVDTGRGKVLLKHEAIASIDMDAMTMPFKVKEAAMLDGIQAGDKVRFSVQVQDDDLLITHIEVLK